MMWYISGTARGDVVYGIGSNVLDYGGSGALLSAPSTGAFFIHPRTFYRVKTGDISNEL